METVSRPVDKQPAREQEHGGNSLNTSASTHGCSPSLCEHDVHVLPIPLKQPRTAGRYFFFFATPRSFNITSQSFCFPTSVISTSLREGGNVCSSHRQLIAPNSPPRPLVDAQIPVMVDYSSYAQESYTLPNHEEMPIGAIVVAIPVLVYSITCLALGLLLFLMQHYHSERWGCTGTRWRSSHTRLALT